MCPIVAGARDCESRATVRIPGSSRAARRGRVELHTHAASRVRIPLGLPWSSCSWCLRQPSSD
eukprot:6291480-Prymnesium_polylepis.1